METPQPAPVSAVADEANATTANAASGVVPPQILLPILRLIPHYMQKMLVVAVYDDHIISGTCSRRFAPTETMLSVEGEAELSGNLHHLRRIEFGEITNIKIHLGRFQQSFQMHAPGKNIAFTLPAAQSGHIREFLRAKLADKVPVRRLPVGKVGAALVLLLGLAVAAIGATLLGVSQVAAWVTGFCGLGLTALGVWLLFGHSSKWVAAGKATSFAALHRKHAAPVAKLPLRSKPLGWTLKLLGLGYWIALVSPLTDSFQQLLGTVFHDSPQAQSYIWTLLWVPAPLLIYYGYRLCQARFVSKQSNDPRKPILFLRPFEDDAHTSLQPTGLTAQATGIRSRSALVPSGKTSLFDLLWSSHPARMVRMLADYSAGSSEESIARYFARFGPVIAIGKPGEHIASPGAARMYVDDASWQDTVLYEMRRAQVVVMQPAPTDGVRWELNHIRDNVDPYRFLFCLVGYWNNPEVYEDLCRVVEETLRVQLPRRVPYLQRPVFVFFDHDWTPHVQELSYKDPMLWPVTADGADMHYSLGGFIEGMEGEPPKQPVRPTKWAHGVKHWLASAVAVVIAIVLVLVVNGTIRLATGWAGEKFGVILPAEEQAAIALQNAPLGTLQGTAVAYQIQVPQSLAEQKTSTPAIEHYLKAADSRFDLQVIAANDSEDVSGLPQQRLKQNQEGVISAQLDSQRQVEEAGVNWIEGDITATVKEGIIVEEIVRGSSSPHGTVVLIVHIVKSPSTDEIYHKLADQILASFRFTDGAGK